MWDLKVYEAIQAGDTNYAMALVGTSLIASRRTLLELEESSMNITYIRNQSRFPEEARQTVFEKIDEIHRAFPREGVSSKASGAIVLPPTLDE